MADVVEKKKVFVVLDLETTGLDESTHEILEIAFIAVDAETLGEFDRFETVLAADRLEVHSMVPRVRDMHTSSGLINAVVLATSPERSEAEALAVNKLNELQNRLGPCEFILAGSSVHFDRGFLREDMPELESMFYHGHADVSSCRRVLGAKPLLPEDKVAHRAMADCETALAEMRALRDAWRKAGL